MAKSKEKVTALIEHQAQFYKAQTIQELEDILEEIKASISPKDERPPIIHKNIRGKAYFEKSLEDK